MLLRIMILTTCSFIIAKMISSVIGSGNSEKAQIEYFITAPHGAIGCLSKDKFREEEKYYKSGDYKAAQKLIDEKICFFLDKGYKLFAPEGTCSTKDKDEDLYPFKPNDFMMLQPYLPCSAVR